MKESGNKRSPYEAPVVPYSETNPDFPEIEEEDFNEMDQFESQPPGAVEVDTRKTVGETFDNVSFDVPELSQKVSSPIEIPDIEERPQKVDEGMGAEL
ncbi:hypothetical protein [Vibrio phage Va2]|nr:hypothetical protein [Vibrio phage Va2]